MEVGVKHHQKVGETVDGVGVMEYVVLPVLLIKYFRKAVNNPINHLGLSRYRKMLQQLSDSLINHHITKIYQINKLVPDLYLHLVIPPDQRTNV